MPSRTRGLLRRLKFQEEVQRQPSTIWGAALRSRRRALAAGSRTSRAFAVVPLNTRTVNRGHPLRSPAPDQRREWRRTMGIDRLRSRVRELGAGLAVSAVCPAARWRIERSRTNAVSSATRMVLELATVLAIGNDHGV
jgi:hypothetical protein